MRLISVLPTMIILATNMAGFIINMMKPSNFKSKLKAILALNIVRESIEVCFNVFMILIRNEFTSIPKEVYFGRFFSNIWWLSLCVSFSKSRWVSSKSNARNSGGINMNINSNVNTGRNVGNNMGIHGYSSSNSGGFNNSFHDGSDPRYDVNDRNDTY